MQANMNPFGFGEALIRVMVDEQGEVWTAARDVAKALQYPDTTLSNMPRLCKHVPSEWKGRFTIPTLGGPQDILCLSEQGLYFFLGRSDKPKALPFQKWLAGDVLPTLRKTGSYTLPGAAALESPAPRWYRAGQGQGQGLYCKAASGCPQAGQGLSKKACHMAGVTSSIRAGCQRGWWSLSTARARMPSSVSLCPGRK